MPSRNINACLPSLNINKLHDLTMPIKLIIRQQFHVFFLGLIMLLLPITALAGQATDQAGNELVNAAGRGQLSRIKSLLAESRPFDQSTLNQALIQATTNGQDKIVEFLLDTGADIDATSIGENRSLLHLATRDDRIDVVRVLLAKGAKKDAISVDGTTALMIAAQYHRIEILRLLIQAGTDIDASNQEGVTALMYAAQLNFQNGVQDLLRAGANVNKMTNSGATALMLAAQNGYQNVTRTLLAAGADPDIKAGNEATALLLAQKYNHRDVIKILLNAGARQ